MKKTYVRHDTISKNSYSKLAQNSGPAVKPHAFHHAAAGFLGMPTRLFMLPVDEGSPKRAWDAFEAVPATPAYLNPFERSHGPFRGLCGPFCAARDLSSQQTGIFFP